MGSRGRLLANETAWRDSRLANPYWQGPHFQMAALITTKSQSLLDSPCGKRLLAVLCAVAFLDFVDASITNVALPHIREALGFSVQTLQWVPC
jgi:hypothetical protein